MSCAIWFHLACNFTKSNTLSWVFNTFFKLYKQYQIRNAPETMMHRKIHKWYLGIVPLH